MRLKNIVISLIIIFIVSCVPSAKKNNVSIEKENNTFDLQFQRAVNQFWRNNIINGLTTIYGEWIPVEFDTFDITLNDKISDIKFYENNLYTTNYNLIKNDIYYQGFLIKEIYGYESKEFEFCYDETSRLISVYIPKYKRTYTYEYYVDKSNNTYTRNCYENGILNEIITITKKTDGYELKKEIIQETNFFSIYHYYYSDDKLVKVEVDLLANERSSIDNVYEYARNENKIIVKETIYTSTGIFQNYKTITKHSDDIEILICENNPLDTNKRKIILSGIDIYGNWHEGIEYKDEKEFKRYIREINYISNTD